VTADGQQFILVKERSRATLNVVVNWLGDLGRAK
jgi:hypothetical protein